MMVEADEILVFIVANKLFSIPLVCLPTQNSSNKSYIIRHTYHTKYDVLNLIFQNLFQLIAVPFKRSCRPLQSVNGVGQDHDPCLISFLEIQELTRRTNQIRLNLSFNSFCNCRNLTNF
jgi:hypothetical protein